MGRTTELRRALKRRFLPYVIERGFVVDQRYQPRSTIFRRRDQARVQMFDLQWEKYGSPRFILHFGTCPPEGLHINGVVHPPDETLPSWCPDTGSLQPRRGASSRSWFRQDATLFQRMMGAPALRDPVAVVEELLALFPELERYWTSAELGPHLRLWHLNRGVQPEVKAG